MNKQTKLSKNLDNQLILLNCINRLQIVKNEQMWADVSPKLLLIVENQIHQCKKELDEFKQIEKLIREI